MARLHKWFKPPHHLRGILNRSLFPDQSGSTLTEALAALSLFGCISYLSVTLIITFVQTDRPQILFDSLAAAMDQIESEIETGYITDRKTDAFPGGSIIRCRKHESEFHHLSWSVLMNSDHKPAYTFHLLIPDTHDSLTLIF